MGKKNNKKRVNFQIPENIEGQFTSQAMRLGISKANLLRSWIKNTKSLKLNVLTSVTKKKTVHFHISSEEFGTVEYLANTYRISNSQVLRLIIQDRLHKVKAVPSIIDESETKRLWDQGEIKKLVDILTIYPRLLTNYQLTKYCEAYLILGNKIKVKEAIEELKERNKTENSIQLHYAIRLCELEQELISRNVINSHNIIQELGRTTELQTERGLKGRYYFLKALYFELIDQIPHSINNYFHALEHYDSINYPHETRKVNLYLAYCESLLLNTDRANLHISLSKNFAQISHSSYLDAIEFLIEGNIYTLMNKTKKAVHSYNLLISLSNKTGYTRGIYYGHNEIGKYYLLNANSNLAHKSFERAAAIEKNFRYSDSTSMSESFKLFCEAKDNYHAARNQIDSKVNSFKPLSLEYIRSSIDLIYGDGDRKYEGQRGLENLLKLKPYQALSEAAAATIETSSFKPFAIR